MAIAMSAIPTSNGISAAAVNFDEHANAIPAALISASRLDAECRNFHHQATPINAPNTKPMSVPIVLASAMTVGLRHQNAQATNPAASPYSDRAITKITTATASDN